MARKRPEALARTHIGPKRAQDIVKYRQTHGLFRRIEDPQNVPGIGPGILEDNRNRIRVRWHRTVKARFVAPPSGG